jgi:hypothetical protein
LRAQARKARGTNVGLESSEELSSDDKVWVWPQSMQRRGGAPAAARAAPSRVSLAAAPRAGAPRSNRSAHVAVIPLQKRIIEERMKYINQKFGKGTIGKLSDAPMKV